MVLSNTIQEQTEFHENQCDTMISILLVDDHELFRSGMKSVLETADDMDIVGEVATGEAALEFLQGNTPDIILMDVNMPGIGGIEATRKIIRSNPDMKIIAVTALSDEPFPNQLLDAGVRGYICKGCPADELFDAIRGVMKGNHYISTDVARKLTLSKFVNRGDSSPLSTLSAREMQVMLMITTGQSTQEICNALFLSPKTISTYRSRLQEKLGVTNDVEMTHFALRHGVIEPV